MTKKSAALLGYDAVMKTSAFVPTPQNNAVAPAPPKAGSVPSPTPAVKAPKLDGGFGGGKSNIPSMSSGTSSTSSGSSTEKSAEDDTTAGVLGGAGGALGGYLLGTKVIDPLIGKRITQLEQLISQGQSTVDKMRKTQNLAPLGAAAIGALVLATIAASRARKNERERLMNEQLLRQQYGASPYLEPYGMTANEVLPFNRGFY